jgi:hypothetical protein
VRQLPEPCKHVFHIACIDEWLKQSFCCPLCKRSVRAMLGGEDDDFLPQQQPARAAPMRGSHHGGGMYSSEDLQFRYPALAGGAGIQFFGVPPMGQGQGNSSRTTSSTRSSRVSGTGIELGEAQQPQQLSVEAMERLEQLRYAIVLHNSHRNGGGSSRSSQPAPSFFPPLARQPQASPAPSPASSSLPPSPAPAPGFVTSFSTASFRRAASSRGSGSGGAGAGSGSSPASSSTARDV